MECDEPGSPWDYALLAVAVVATVPFIAANIVVFLHRKRMYFGAQGGALLILTSSIAGIICIAASFISDSHFHRNTPFLMNCALWSLWLKLTFGLWLWLTCQVLRLLHLHYLCQSTASRCRMLLWALLLWTPGLAFTIVATASKTIHLEKKGEACEHCQLTDPWQKYTYFILPLFYFSILIILLIYVKNNKDYIMATEYSHTIEYTFLMNFMVYIAYGAPFLLESQKRIPGRCFLTFCICCTIFTNFWVRLGWPVYLCLCKSKSEMDSFEEELRSCGTVCLDQLSSATGTSRARRRSSSTQQFGDWILRAIDAAMNEVSECKERINQLEQRKAALSTKIEQLKASSVKGV